MANIRGIFCCPSCGNPSMQIRLEELPTKTLARAVEHHLDKIGTLEDYTYQTLLQLRRWINQVGNQWDVKVD